MTDPGAARRERGSDAVGGAVTPPEPRREVGASPDRPRGPVPIPAPSLDEALDAAPAPPYFPDDPDGYSLYGLVSFDGPERCASAVVVPFGSAVEADRYATRHGLDDYVVAPLSFLAAR